MSATPGTPRTLDSLPGPKGWPLLGSVLELRPETSHLAFERWAREHCTPYTFRIGRSRAVAIAAPDAVRAVMQDRPDAFRRISALEDVAADAGLVGVFAAEGKDWRRQRRLMNPSFHAAHLETFHPAIATIVGRLLRHWDGYAERGEPVDVLHDLMRFTVDVTSVVAFGRDLNTVERGADTLQRHLEVIFPTFGRRLVAPFRYWRALPFVERDFQAALGGVRAVMLELVAEARGRIAGRPPGETKPRTLLEAMILARDDEEAKEPLSDEEIYANVITLLLAGEDTTANTLAWMLHYLATRFDVQATARSEVLARVHGEVATTSELRELPYVDALALETLRLRSPAPQILLEARRDVVIEGAAIPAGTAVVLLTRYVGMNPEHFGDPTRFRPERWMPDAPSDTRPHQPRLMLAFGGGPRVCPGRGLALMECALLTSAVLRRFELRSAAPEWDVREVTAFTTQPSGVRVLLRRREASRAT